MLVAEECTMLCLHCLCRATNQGYGTLVLLGTEGLEFLLNDVWVRPSGRVLDAERSVGKVMVAYVDARV